MKRYFSTKALAALSVSAMMLSTAHSAEAAELKPDLSVAGRTVKLADLFYDTGDHGETVVFEAPAPGKTKSISAHDLVRLAKQYDLDWEKPVYLKRVTLSRLSETLPASDISALVHEMAIEQGANPDSQIRFFGRLNGLTVPIGSTLQDLAFEDFSLHTKQDRFTSILLVPSGGDVPTKVSLNGTIEEVRDIPVFNRSILPGEQITANDIEWIEYPASRLNSRAIVSAKQLIGMTVRRAVRSDKPINNNDVTTPVAIEKGEAVTMLVRTSAMVLTAGGRALENGGVGDIIRVLNSKSRLTVDAKVIRPGQVEILSAPNLVLSSR
jgi:flagella basal body P-ring formation protein FlgA